MESKWILSVSEIKKTYSFNQHWSPFKSKAGRIFFCGFMSCGWRALCNRLYSERHTVSHSSYSKALLPGHIVSVAHSEFPTQVSFSFLLSLQWLKPYLVWTAVTLRLNTWNTSEYLDACLCQFLQQLYCNKHITEVWTFFPVMSI